VGYRLDWTNVKDVKKASSKLTVCFGGDQKPLSEHPMLALAHLSGGASGIWPEDTMPPQVLYFQFERNCDQREAMAEAHLDVCRDKGFELPAMTRISNYIPFDHWTTGNFVLEGCKALANSAASFLDGSTLTSKRADWPTLEGMTVCAGAIEATKEQMREQHEACPGDIGLVEAADAVVRYIESHDGHSSYPALIYAALREQWPCKNSEPPKKGNAAD
jgi:hypothetical protein